MASLSQIAMSKFPPGPESSELTLGVNYTAETLAYMSPWVRAEDVTKNVLRYYQGNPFVVIDATAGIGGNTLSFLKNDVIKAVISYEKNPERRGMLKRNIRAYHLDHKSVVPNASFDGTSIKQFSGCCMFMDPPWLPEGFDPSRADRRENYFKTGMKVGGKTIEEWLAQFTGVVYLFVLKSPPGYTLNPVEGWHYQHYDVKRSGKPDESRMWFCHSIAAASFVTSNQGGAKPLEKFLINASLPAAERKTYEQDPLLLYDRFEPKEETKEAASNFSSWEALGSTLPSPTPGMVLLSEQWKEEFKAYIQAFLRAKDPQGNRMIPDDMVLKLTGSEEMKIWEQAMTSETYDIDNNYETLEALGDAILDVTFKKYAVRRFPKITSNVLSEYKSRYMSTEFQGTWTELLGLHRWIVTAHIQPTVAMYTDIFESFIGALDAVSDQVFYGTGMINVMNYITLLFNDVVFDPNMVYGNYKTVAIQQYAQLFKWDEHYPNGGIKTRGIRVKTDDHNGLFRSTVTLSKTGIKFLKALGLDVKNPFIATEGPTKEESEASAYEATVKKLISFGLNRDYIDAYRDTAPFMRFDQAKKDQIMQSNDVVKLRFNIVRKASDDKTTLVQLLGIRSNGSKVLISTGVAPTEEEARKIAFDNA